MAVQLHEWLQENRKFLAGAVVASALFIAGTVVIGALYGRDLQSARREQHQVGNVAKETRFTKANLESARGQEDALTKAAKGLDERLRFETRPEFQLKPNAGSPANQYLDIAAALRERRLDEARARGIDVPDHSGMPERAPTQIEDIQRTLRGLDLVDRVLEQAFRARVRGVERIAIEKARGRERKSASLFRDEVKVEIVLLASSPALSTFLEGTQEGRAPLVIESFASVPAAAGAGRSSAARGEALVRATAVFVALDPIPQQGRE